MATKPTDQDLAVLAYQDRMKPMARTMVKWADRAVTAMSKDIVAYLQGNGYIPDPAEASKWMVRPADSSAILRLTELARQLPEKDQRRVMASLMGDIGNGRLTRKKAIERMLQLNARALVQDLGRDVRRTLVSVADEASLRGVYMLQKQVGVGWNVDGINARRIQTMAKRVYGDKAAWDSLSAVEKQVNQQTMQAIMLGESTDKLAHRIREVKQTEVWKSKREARTKITEVSNQAHSDAYEEHGVKRYQFMATYDERTCPICGRLDGKKFKIEDKKVGVNYPPMHPNCRCTTVAVMSKEIEELMAPRKLLVDKKTMTYKEIPRDYSYEDWYNEYGPGRLGKKFDAGAEPKVQKKASYPQVSTPEEAEKALVDTVGFKQVESSYQTTVQPEMKVATTNQLLKLESRYGAVGKSQNPSIISESDSTACAFVRCKIMNPLDQSLSLCPRTYKQYDRKKEMEERDQKWIMPFKDEEAEVYTVTHEYGHMVQNTMIADEMKAQGWDPNNASAMVDYTAHTPKGMFKWYTDIRKKVAKGCKKEIVDIAKESDPSFKYADYISDYGKTNDMEFFAEVFANSQLGAPNKLGLAMKEWLKRKGFNADEEVIE